MRWERGGGVDDKFHTIQAFVHDGLMVHGVQSRDIISSRFFKIFRASESFDSESLQILKNNELLQIVVNVSTTNDSIDIVINNVAYIILHSSNYSYAKIVKDISHYISYSYVMYHIFIIKTVIFT